MKKTILTTTLALGLGVTGVSADQNAEASEINKGELAQMAQADSNELNNAPIHEGEYNYNFTVDGVNYNFESDGTYYTWSYGGYSNETPQNEVTETAQQEDAPQVTEESNEQTQQVAPNTEQQESAPQVTEETQQQPEQNTQQSEDVQAAAPEQNTESSEATGGSTKEQFLAAGGTEAMWQNIVMPESSGDPNAVNELGYKGLGQTKESWGTGSVEEQTEGMINYAQERYGSIDAAMEFRAANNWW
ncbi:hypothetical protein [Salinicoccus halodurans]|uniref:Transglycosylase n=1 Tax=Salinicoccus halodurans TaxID=407035 RepID=A0A0F7D3N9_9STAP|nr:hypothetical protein [Salinicoccus halodurans]AKG72815.1 hypothetical protein AAT16_00415 [Salinicoccus halodurans]SFK74578.1 hypothetical protein SAMN05216235_1447 [Salinicoccus halodurans]